MPNIDLIPSTTIAEVETAWTSKINWTQAIATIAMFGTVFGIDLDPKTQVSIVAGIQGVSAVATWIMRTWYTSTITPASL